MHTVQVNYSLFSYDSKTNTGNLLVAQQLRVSFSSTDSSFIKYKVLGKMEQGHNSVRSTYPYSTNIL